MNLIKHLILLIAVFGILYLANLYFPVLSVPVSGAFIVFVILFLESRRMRFLQERISAVEHIARNIDSGMISIEKDHAPVRILGVPVDIPWDRGMIWPDLAEYLIQVIFLYRSKNILECGSGVSTHIIASCLRHRGEGHLVSLEHDRFWVEKVRRNLELENLSSYVEVREAPLLEQSIEGRSVVWYRGVDLLRSQGPYDLILVDGPPSVKPTDPGREGALYALFPAMRRGTLLLLDDENRPGEKITVEKWKAQYKESIQVKYIDFKKGLWLIEKVSPDSQG